MKVSWYFMHFFWRAHAQTYSLMGSFALSSHTRGTAQKLPGAYREEFVWLKGKGKRGSLFLFFSGKSVDRIHYYIIKFKHFMACRHRWLPCLRLHQSGQLIYSPSWFPEILPHPNCGPTLGISICFSVQWSVLLMALTFLKSPKGPQNSNKQRNFSAWLILHAEQPEAQH